MSKQVLVVDDDRVWLDQVSSIVSACGHIVFSATNSRGARRILREGSFDLLITDNWMEYENSGIDLLMENWYEDQEIPSILYTSELEESQRTRLQRELPQVIVVQKASGLENPKLMTAISQLLS